MSRFRPVVGSSSEGTVSALKGPVFEFERKQAQSSCILAHGDLWLERRRAAVAGEILRFAGVEHVLFRCVSRDLGNSDEIRRGSRSGPRPIRARRRHRLSLTPLARAAPGPSPRCDNRPFPALA